LPDSRAVPTAGVLGVIVVAGVLHLLGRVTEGGWLALASAAVLVLPVVALLTRPRLAGLHVTREVHGQPVVGQASEVTLRLTNQGHRMTAPVVVTDDLPGHEPVRVSFPALRPGGSAGVRLPREAVQRVSTASGRVRLEAPSPIGLLRSKVTLAVPGQVVVHPAPASLRVLPDGLGGPGTSATSLPLPGVGTEVLGLRDWRLGESSRAVSARASARHGRPLILEREREGAPSLVVAVGPGRGPAWEAHLSTAASLATAAVRDGRPVVLRGLPLEARTARQVLDAFAAADAAVPLDGASLHGALQQAGPGGVLVVVPGDLARADVAGHLPRLRQAAGAIRCSLVVLE
jgi:uncharacterized protein (DUF58 family)